MGRKNLKQKIAFVLATIVGTNILWQNIAISSPKEEIKTLQSLGDYKTYNGVVFGKHTASGADVEGKLAVKGDIEAPTIGNSFSIAAAFNGNNVAVGNPIIDTTTPTFLLGGEIIDTGTTAEGVKRNLLLSAGIGVLTSKANKDLLKSADKFEAIIEKSEAEVYETFDKIQNDINKSIEKVKTIESSDEKVSGSTLKFARAKLNKNILINEEWRNEKHLDFKGIDSWEFRIPKLEENDHLIMYSEAETINFDRALYYEGKEIGTYDKALMHKLAPRILWVFPNAKTIETLRVDVPGSIIAPNATVNVYGGSINGQVFTNDLNQIEKDTAKNGQLHNFIFNWDILNDLEVAKGSLEIKKVESDNQDLVLSGAEFVIKDVNGNEVARGTTDKNGIARFENLVAGTYTYEEIKAPDGYELNNEPVEFKITKQGEVITKVVENKKIIIKGTLEIKKVDAKNKDLALPGAEFVIKDVNGNEVAKGTTDEKGIAKFENLVAGTYTYEEVKAPEGYELNSKPIEFEITKQGEVITKVVENKKIIIKGALEIKKVDADNKDLALQGAEFVIKDVNGNEVAKGTTDKNGIARFENLVAGTYTYEEVKAPEGYELNNEPVEFKITDQGQVVTKVVENNKVIIKGALEIKKVDADNKDLALQGAEFVIKDVNGNEVAKGTTDKNGIARFENLVAGKYTYEEIKAPDGYELNNEPVEFKITDQGQVVTKVVENNKIIIKGALEIKKVDADNKDLALTGAEFIIKDASGNEVAKGTTDEKGIARFENLVAGTYTYEEIKAPEGYELNGKPIEFEITKQGQVVTKVVENNKIIIKGALEIKKVDADNKDLVLQGAEFVIKDVNGNEVAKGTTDKNGIARFENLVAGKYTYEEIKAPEGYELKGKQIEFEITKQDEVITKVVENNKIIIKGALEIKKVDADNKDLALQGAEFVIKDVNGNEVAKGTTDEKGIAKFENLVAGTYIYEEIKAPEGYELNGEAVEFEITKQGEIVTKVVENKKSEDNTTGKPETPDEPNNPEDTEKPEKPDEPSNPEDTEKPETPDEPSNPEDTEKPETPDEPSNPEDTEKPETPDEPSNPEDTEKPETPDEPSNPEDTEKPEKPDKPSNPEDTEKPEKPDEPSNPEDTEKPETPDEPSNPEDTEKPEKPDEPSNPEDTEKPETPDEPSDPEDTEKPETPDEPSDPEDTEKPEKPGEPSDQEDTEKLENPGKPSNPEDSGDSENPKKPEDSDELNKPNEQGNNIQNGANINQILGGERLPKTGDAGVMHYSIFSMLAISALFGINKKRKNKK